MHLKNNASAETICKERGMKLILFYTLQFFLLFSKDFKVLGKLK